MSKKQRWKSKRYLSITFFFSWFEEEEERKKEKYWEKVDELFDGKELVSDASVGSLEEKDKEIYGAYVKRQNEIDLAKVPEGETLEQVQREKSRRRN